MTVPTMRPDDRRKTASWLVCGTIALALLTLPSTADAAAAVEVDLGALDALPPATAAAPGAVRLRPPTPAKPAATAAKPAPTAAKAPPAEPSAGAAKPGSRSTLRLTPSMGAPADSTPAEAAAAPAVVPPPPSAAPAAAAPPLPGQAATSPPLAALPPPPPPATTPAATTTPSGRLLFTGSSFDLSADAKSELDGVAKRLAGDPRLYLQLMAYAGGSGDGSEARRLSLSRALAARSYLLDHGIDGKQVDVRPLGNKSEPGLPPDRIDCVVTTR